MRNLFIAAAALVAVGIVLIVLWRPEAPETAALMDQKHADGPEQAQEVNAEPERLDDAGVRGLGHPASTQSLMQAPSEKDGVLEVEVKAGEEPVANAKVRLYWRGERDPNLGEVDWRLAGTGSTNEQGRVSLPSSHGGYHVAVDAQGYAPLRRDVVRPYGEPHTRVRLTLHPPQVLIGRTVVQGSEEPLPLVELVLTAHGRPLEPWESAEAPAEERFFAASDAWGNFRVEGLAPGDYTLEARAPGHARTLLGTVPVPAAEPLTVALRRAAVIEGFVLDAQGNPAADALVEVSGKAAQQVSTGQGGGFSVEVEPGTYTVSAHRGEEAGSLDKPVSVGAGKTVRDVKLRLGQGAVLDGRVVSNATGVPVAGARVGVRPGESKGDSGRVVTDGDGHFSVTGLAPGSYDLTVSAPRFSPGGRSRLVVGSGERFSLEIRLVGTGSVEGHVKDETDQPLQGVRVTAGTSSGGSWGSALAETRTDSEGNYRLEGLATGGMFMIVHREGAGPAQRKLVEVVELVEGRTVRADFVVKKTGTVEGVVRAALGRLPAGGLSVTAVEGANNGPFSSLETVWAELDAGGHFRMELPSGQYGLRVMPKGRGKVSRIISAQVQVEAGKTAQVELTWQSEEPDFPTLQGIVLEPEGGPSLGASVVLDSDAASRVRWGSTQADEEGRFSLSLPRRQDAAASSLRLKGFNGGRRGETLIKPGDQNVVVRLQPSASVRGRVSRVSGADPVKGFTLTLFSMAQPFAVKIGTLWRFPGDRFELRDVPAEPLKLLVQAQDGALGEVDVSPAPGSSAEVQVVLKVMAGVRGRVVDALTKVPVPHALIFVEGESWNTADNVSLADGRFTLQGLRPGERQLIVRITHTMHSVRRVLKLVEGQVIDVGDIEIVTPGQ